MINNKTKKYITTFIVICSVCTAIQLCYSNIVLSQYPEFEVKIGIVDDVNNLNKLYELKQDSTIAIKGCRNEYVPVLISLKADVKYDNTIIDTTDLVDNNHNKITKDNINIKIIKKWYQSGNKKIRYTNKKYLVPELLLNNDKFIVVDESTETNYIHINNDGKKEYFNISDPNSKLPFGASLNDEAKFQPFVLEVNKPKQLWITVKIPDNANSGGYAGIIKIVANGKIIRNIKLNVTVNPFNLAEPLLEYSIYYRGLVTSEYKAQIGSEFKTPEQYKRELIDLREHGISYPTIFQRFDDYYLNEALSIRSQVGLPTKYLYTTGTTTANKTDAKGLIELDSRVKIWMKYAQRYGYDEVYLYGVDEASGDRLISQYPSWNVVHRNGAKIFAALYEGAVDFAGYYIDRPILSGYKPAEVAKWHKLGKRVLCYGNPQVGVEDPLVYRKNYGFLLWVGGYDGCMTYAYQHGFNDIWNDFDHPEFRDHVFAYPTTDGVISTVQWEGFREAVDDIRYLSTLLRLEPQAEPEIRKYIQDQLIGKQSPPSKVREWIVERILRHNSTNAR